MSLTNMNNAVNISLVSKIFIWANSDLDGACSTILLGQVFPQFEYQCAFFGSFETLYDKWVDNIDNYDKVFIIGMVIDQRLMNKLDDPRIVIISDRGENLTADDSTLFIENRPSCSLLIYQKFKKVKDFSVEHKKLALYANDYNDYRLKYEESKYLNALYRRMGYKKFYNFVERFWNGYDGFTDTELSLVQEFFDELNDECESLDLYSGEYEGFSVLSTFTKFSVNEIAKKLLDNHPADVIIVVNPDTKFVSFRKSPSCRLNVGTMAEKLCDGGGGEWASGGNITKKFLEFSESLKML